MPRCFAALSMTDIGLEAGDGRGLPTLELHLNFG
jgi:hypothetical protein